MKTITDDLAARLALLHTRYQVVMGEFTAAEADRLPIDHAADFYADAAAMLESGLRAAVPDAIGKVRAVVDPADLDRAEFWGTELGRLLFVSGGYVGETITQAATAGLLGCSRQWVNAMVADGKLTPAANRGVYAAQVRGVLLHRAERVQAMRRRRAEVDKPVN
jgi:hypothetical protein